MSKIFPALLVPIAFLFFLGVFVAAIIAAPVMIPMRLWKNCARRPPRV